MTVFSSYKITSEATRKVVTVSSRGLLRQYSSDDSGRQRFRRLASGKTQLASRAFNDATVVDAIGGDLTAPASLQVYPSHGGPNQLWTITEEGVSEPGLSGHKLYSIKADNTNMAWDIPYGTQPGGQNDGNYVQIYPWHGEANQLWQMEEKPIDLVMFKSMHSNFVLDVPGFEFFVAYIQHYPQNDGFNQFWEVLPSGSSFKIRSASSGLFLMSSSILVDDDTLVFQAVSSTDPRQLWNLDFDSSNIGTIRNVGTSRFLSVPPGPVVSATPVHGLAGDGTADHQRWRRIS